VSWDKVLGCVVCRFHVAAGEKLHADKFSGAIVRSVAKLVGINLRKFGSFSYWFDNLLLGFPTSFMASTTCQQNNNHAPILVALWIWEPPIKLWSCPKLCAGSVTALKDQIVDRVFHLGGRARGYWFFLLLVR
jgi:hypothetical protein